jgi:hypothetical protein
MDYLVLDPGYNFGTEADVMFATYNKAEAIEAATDFGHGTVVVFVGQEGNKKRIFIAPYKTELPMLE